MRLSLRSSSTCRAAAVFVVLLLTFATGAQPVPADKPDFQLRRGVIVDARRSAVYLSAPGGGIEAVELGSGRVLWRSDDAALPLGLNNRLLVAQIERAEGGLRLAILDAGNDGRKIAEGNVALPDGVRAIVTDTARATFRVTAEADGDGFVIAWSYVERDFSGMARLPGQRVPTTSAEGGARVRLAGGRIDVAEAPANARRPRTDALSENLMQSAALPHAPWRAGDVLAISTGGRNAPLTLKRWDARSGAVLPERELVRKAVAALPSADTKHIVASERVGGGGPDDPEYRWSIFSLERGERVGELRRDVSAAPFFLSNGNIIFEAQPRGYLRGEVWIEEPLELEAVRLSTGVPLWGRAVRDFEYRGPQPPAR